MSLTAVHPEHLSKHIKIWWMRNLYWNLCRSNNSDLREIYKCGRKTILLGLCIVCRRSVEVFFLWYESDPRSVLLRLNCVRPYGGEELVEEKKTVWKYFKSRSVVYVVIVMLKCLGIFCIACFHNLTFNMYAFHTRCIQWQLWELTVALLLPSL